MRATVNPTKLPLSGATAAPAGVAIDAANGMAVPYDPKLVIEVEAGGAPIDVTVPESPSWRSPVGEAPGDYLDQAVIVTIPAGERALIAVESAPYQNAGLIYLDFSPGAAGTVRAFALA